MVFSKILVANIFYFFQMKKYQLMISKFTFLACSHLILTWLFCWTECYFYSAWTIKIGFRILSSAALNEIFEVAINIRKYSFYSGWLWLLGYICGSRRLFYLKDIFLIQYNEKNGKIILSSISTLIWLKMILKLFKTKKYLNDEHIPLLKLHKQSAHLKIHAELKDLYLLVELSALFSKHQFAL